MTDSLSESKIHGLYMEDFFSRKSCVFSFSMYFLVHLLFSPLYSPNKHLLSICLIIHLDICFLYVHTDSVCISQLILTIHYSLSL